MAASIKKSSSRPITVKLKHTGLVFGLMDADNLAGKINAMIGKSGTNVQIQSGELAKLAIMRFLSGDMPGGINSIEQFASTLPANLFASSETCEGNPYLHANRYSLSDMLDRIAEYGPTKFSTEILSSLVDKNSITTAHLDSTSYHFHGHPQYNLVEIANENSKEPTEIVDVLPDNPISLAHGYSRDNRSDLPQVNHLGISARVDGVDTAVMLYQAAFDGNMNDNTRFQKFCADGELDYLKQAYPNMKTLVADSAAANALTVKACHECGIELVTRLSDSRVKKDFDKVHSGIVPLSTVEVPVPAWAKAGTKPDNISYAWLGTQELKSKDGGSVEVLKIMFVAESMRELKTASIKRRAEKELKDIEAKLAKLVTVPRSCEADAKRDFEEFTKKLKYVTVSEPQYEEIKGYAKAGRPSANAEKVVTGVKVHAKAAINEDVVNSAIERELYYVVATTNLSTELTEENALNLYQVYHGQSDIESQWKELKATGTFFDSIYLHSERRIRALLSIVTIALFYARKLITCVRRALEKHGLSLSLHNEPDCSRPTLKTFLRFASGEREDSDMLISKGLVWLPDDIETSILYLVALEIGDEAVKFYTEDFYLKHSEFIYNSILDMRTAFKESRVSEN